MPFLCPTDVDTSIIADNDATHLLRTASLDLKPKQEQDLRSDSGKLHNLV